MQKKLGFLAIMTLASTIVPLTATAAFASPTPLPGTSAIQRGGYWYCFGRLATITQPDDDGTYRGTAIRDVIVTSDGPDIVRQVGPGDRVCSRGGDDEIGTLADVNLTTGWDRVKVDAGKGNDAIEVDSSWHDWDDPAAKWIILEAHAGPGDDQIFGGGGNDQIYTDGGADYVNCSAGKYDVLHRIPGQSVTKRGCEKTVDAKAYATFGKFKPNTGSWSLVCPGEPSKSVKWYVSSTSYGVTNPCSRWVGFSYNVDFSGPTGATIYWVKPGTKLYRKGNIARDEMSRTIRFRDPADGPPCSDGSTDEFVTHNDGRVTPAAPCPEWG